MTGAAVARGQPGGLTPGKRTPSVVNAAGFLRDPFAYVRWLYGRYGPVAGVRLPGVGWTIWLADPALVKQVLTGDASLFHAGEANASLLEPIMGRDALATLDGEPHMRRRKLVLPALHGDRMRRWSRRPGRSP